jgi:outer membrane protein assembly factor BamD (BamD/ComL family)
MKHSTQKKKRTILLFFLIHFVISGAGTIWAYDNYYLFKQGNVARGEGNLSEAIQLYQDYINSHPFTQETGFSGTIPKNGQYFLRNLLMAYDNLCDLLRENSRADEIDYWLNKLKASYQPGKYGSKNIYNLARILQENNCQNDSIVFLEKIIAAQKDEYRPGNNKVFLRAASKLLDIYEKLGEHDKQVQLYQNLQQCPTSDFDYKDKDKLATLYLKNEQTRKEGERLLTDLITQNGSDSFADREISVKAGIGLMKSKKESKDTNGLQSVVDQFKVFAKDSSKKLSPPSMYKLAVALLKYENKEEGKKLLFDISNNHKDTVWARKSLFLLGRIALSDEDWDSAIDYYSTYIERYPEQTFFCLKAYSNLLDAYWSRDGDIEKQKVAISHFADILNETADYETHLNMARELSYKGFDQLADATFIMGYTYAQDIIAKNSNTLDAMRVNWQLTKYAYEIGKIELAREAGESAVEQYEYLKASLSGAEEKEKADHYLSRTYLWLAKIYEDTDEKDRATEVLQQFVSKFPVDSDIDYAEYNLGRLYEDDKQIKKAIELYRKADKGQWKDKADLALKRIGAE